jgi:hypothetical protein
MKHGRFQRTTRCWSDIGFSGNSKSKFKKKFELELFFCYAHDHDHEQRLTFKALPNNFIIKLQKLQKNQQILKSFQSNIT